MKKISSVLLLAVAICGCSNPGVVEISPDTYMLAREAHGGIFASPAALKAGVIEDANKFASSKGKVAVPISSQEKPMGNGPAQWASFEYQFRVVDKDDPIVRRAQLVKNPNVIIQKEDQDITDKKTGKSEPHQDMYTELMKLEELRKSGVITDEEFAVQKKKVLSAQ